MASTHTPAPDRCTCLVTGASGLLGPFLVEALSEHWTVVTTSTRDPSLPCDLTDAAATRRLVASQDPDVIVNAAAMTNVDLCETEPDAAMAVNCTIVKNLVSAIGTQAQPAKLVQISTDLVYPDQPGPHAESPTGPVNVYGRTKLAGEACARSLANALVLRTSFFAESRTPSRESLSDFVVRSLRCGHAITLFEDVQFSPLHATTLADLVLELVQEDVSGTFNTGSREGFSKAAFGLSVARRFGLQTDTVTIGRSTDIACRAPRTSDLRMDVAKLEATRDGSMPTLESEIGKL